MTAINTKPTLVMLSQPKRFDVELTRLPTIRRGDAGEPIHRDLQGDLIYEPHTNIPWSVISHSPTGFEWGYGGSGPADCALNILNAFVPPGSDDLPPIKCYGGECSETAWRLHQKFKWDFIAQMPHAGGTIKAADIQHWIENMIDEQKLKTE